MAPFLFQVVMKTKIVFSDFDGTLTLGTELTSQFFDIVEMLKNRNIPLVVVTGRSISWGHFLITHIPYLDYVIAEGGGVIIKRDDKGLPVDEFLVDELDLKRIAHYATEVCRNFEGLKLSVDSQGRVVDRAIELEDIVHDLDLVKSIKSYFDSENVKHSTSSVHVNFWCGDVSKYQAVELLLKKYYPEIGMEDGVFFGDSMNDESMFESYPHTVGVSNINKCVKNMKHAPKVILLGEGNEGPKGVFNHLQSLLK